MILLNLIVWLTVKPILFSAKTESPRKKSLEHLCDVCGQVFSYFNYNIPIYKSYLKWIIFNFIQILVLAVDYNVSIKVTLN